MDLSKLSPAEKIIAASGVVLLLVSFFDWFGIAGGGVTAWDNVWSALAVLVGIVMVLQILIARFSTAKLPTLPVPWGQVHLILGVLALGLVILQLAIGDKVEVGGITVLELERKIGVFLGLIAAAGLAYGGFLRSKEPEVASGYMP